MILLSLFQPKIVAIVPAAGIGRRMISDVPKQYIKIKDRTVLEHTLITLLRHPSISYIIVSLHPQDNYFHKLSISSNLRIISVIGGKKRTNSVFSGLKIVKNIDWIIIHDAVRPCLSYNDLDKLLDIIKNNPRGALLARPVCDTIKYSDIKQKKSLYTIRRKNLWHALTPQLFRTKILKNCLKKIIEDNISITDEASALEYYGYKPSLVLGSRKNIKITCPEDLILAEFYLKSMGLI